MTDPDDDQMVERLTSTREYVVFLTTSDLNPKKWTTYRTIWP